MVQQLMWLLPKLVDRIHGPAALAIAVLGLLISLVGARFSRAIITLALVSTGTAVGLQMPRWFGWGIDPMGTAFGAAILLGMSGYVLSTMWEGMLLGTLLASLCGAAIWLKLAPLSAWHRPQIEFSQTASEIGYALWQSLPPAVNRALPIAIGIGATVGTVLMVFGPKLGRSFFYALLGMTAFVGAGAVAVAKSHPQWLLNIPQDPWTDAAFFGLMIIFSTGLQWIMLPKSTTAVARQSSDKKNAANHFVAQGPAMQVQYRASGFSAADRSLAGRITRSRQIPARMK